MTTAAPPSNSAARARRKWVAAGLILLFAVAGTMRFLHTFLAINQLVPADTLIVEGWTQDNVLAGAVREFQRGGYTRVFVSGLQYQAGDPNFAEGSDAARATRRLIELGIPAAAITPCPANFTTVNRTSHMARAVRDKMRELNYNPRGANAVTLGPHARQTLLAFQRMLGSKTAVGVMNIPKIDYDPDRWWASTAGLKKTLKDFVGWFKELLFGLRS